MFLSSHQKLSCATLLGLRGCRSFAGSNPVRVEVFPNLVKRVIENMAIFRRGR